jgi:DNA polymerase III alpha subunit
VDRKLCHKDDHWFTGSVVCLTGGDEGPLAAALARGGFEAGRKEVERLVSIFGPENVYVEIQRHFDRQEEWRKALGLDRETLNRVSGRVASFEWKGPKDSLEKSFRAGSINLHHGRMRKFLELTARLQDLPRHLGQHSGGMIICQGQLSSVVPLERASMPGRVVVQWDKEDCADMKMIKVDFLGLGMMAAMSDCLELVPRH